MNSQPITFVKLFTSAIVLCILSTAFSWVYTSNRISSNIGSFGCTRHFVFMMSDPDGNQKKKPKSTKFDRMIDDFMGKRYGQGEVFYGKRTSDMSDEEFEELNSGDAPKDDPETGPLQDNAILLVGGLDSMAQWIGFDLAEKGFNIRVICETLKEGMECFGKSGENVDLVILSPSSSEESYARAVQGVQAVILCGNFLPVISFGPLLEPSKRYVKVASKLLDIATRARTAGVGEVKKIVHLSRSLPWLDGASNGWSKIAPAGSVSPAPPVEAFLSSAPDAAIFDEFRSFHNVLEEVVKRSEFDYVIVRAPPVVLDTRAASRYRLLLVQSPDNLPPDSLEYVVTSKGRVDLKIGQLDLAEAVVQSMLSSRSRLSFTVAEDPTDPILIKKREMEAARSTTEKLNALLGDVPDEWETIPVPAVTASPARGPERPARNSYYGVLYIPDEELKTAYTIRAEESIIGQLTEDELVEKYWEELLRGLKKDVTIDS